MYYITRLIKTILLRVVIVSIFLGCLMIPIVSGTEAETPTVYLTFDDGPSAITDQVLDILKDENVSATFFVVGNETEEGTRLYNRIIDEGHMLGIHTYTHDAQELYKSVDLYIDDFERLERLLLDTTGVSTKICRMPGGSNSMYCSSEVKEGIINYFDKRGYRYFDWNIDPKDAAGEVLQKSTLVNNVIAASQELAGENLVILLHDNAVRTSLPDALTEIIHHFRSQGYNFDSLNEDTEYALR